MLDIHLYSQNEWSLMIRENKIPVNIQNYFIRFAFSNKNLLALIIELAFVKLSLKMICIFSNEVV